jgi:hypothetical protein
VSKRGRRRRRRWDGGGTGTESKTRTPHKDVGKIAKAQNTHYQENKKIPK